MQKKALIFDCFGVVVYRVLGSWISDNLGPEFGTNEIFNKIDIGEVSEHDALLYFSKLVNRPPEIVRKEIDSYFKPNTELVDYMKELRTKGYKIILLSNATHSFFERFVFVEHPWFAQLFDHIVISSTIKMIKPNSDIYLYTLNKNNLNPEDSIFIDDKQENIVGAEKVGIASILFHNAKQLKEDLLRFNVK